MQSQKSAVSRAISNGVAAIALMGAGVSLTAAPAQAQSYQDRAGDAQSRVRDAEQRAESAQYRADVQYCNAGRYRSGLDFNSAALDSAQADRCVADVNVRYAERQVERDIGRGYGSLGSLRQLESLYNVAVRATLSYDLTYCRNSYTWRRGERLNLEQTFQRNASRTTCIEQSRARAAQSEAYYLGRLANYEARILRR